MKKIHKKIGAVALASMIVAGGFAASKVESHAWGKSPSVVISGYNLDLNKLPHNARVDADYLIDFLKFEAKNIKVIAASNDKNALDNYIKIKYDDDSELIDRLLKVPADCFYGKQVIAQCIYEKSLGNEIVKVKFSDAYVLLSVK